MTEQLGQIERPEASEFLAKKKIYLVPLILQGHEPPAEYVEKFQMYWKQAAEHISSLEARIGQVNHVYHESVLSGGEEGLSFLEKVSLESFKITKEKCQNGALLEVIEDKELVEENMDWERFLMMGFISEKAARLVTASYMEVSKKRYEYISAKLSEMLKEGEAALLFIREGHRVQFPKDIEVFSVAPPALDELHRWVRDEQSKHEKEHEEHKESTGA